LDREKAPPKQIIFTDSAGIVVGAAETTQERPDVPESVKDITMTRVGWHGEIQNATGRVNAMALESRNTLCRLGSKLI
jgi:hypothetical protein